MNTGQCQIGTMLLNNSLTFTKSLLVIAHYAWMTITYESSMNHGHDWYIFDHKSIKLKFKKKTPSNRLFEIGQVKKLV